MFQVEKQWEFELVVLSKSKASIWKISLTVRPAIHEWYAAAVKFN